MTEGESAEKRDGDLETVRPLASSPSRPLALSRSLPLVLIATLWALCTLLWLSPGIVKPDGAGYYVYLPSTYFDHDLLFFDEWGQLGMIQNGRILHKEVTRTDHLGNHWTVGSAVYWFPSFVAGDAMRAAIPSLQRFARNGFSLPYNLAVAFASAVAGLLTLLIGFRQAREQRGEFNAAVAALTVWVGTPLMWYSLRNAVMSHAISALACALAFAAAMRVRKGDRTAHWISAGLAAGFAFAVRPQNAPILLVPFFLARPSPRNFGAYAGASFLAVLPQLMVSWSIYGNPFAFLWGGDAHPFAAFERVWSWEPLLSWYHGLIPWAPITLVSLIGLFVLWRRDRRLAGAFAFFFASQWFINATMERSFWGGFAFGQRRFDNSTFIFLFCAAVLFGRLPRWLSASLAAACSLWTFSLFAAAVAGGLDLSRYYTPAELLQRQADGLRNLSFRLLASVPPQLLGTVLTVVVVLSLLWLGIGMGVRRASPRVRLGGVALYFFLMTLWFGLNAGRHNLPVDAGLLQRNRALAALPGGADARFGLLSDELEYLRKSGRDRLAAETELELQRLVSARRSAEGGID